MDGKTPVAKRKRIIDEFNREESQVFCFLLTTRTGGVGLNLIGADRVFIFDPDWNPSVDKQAVERVFRIGQKRSVLIYRLITSGTIEEKMYHRQIHKRLLTEKILSHPDQKRLFSDQEIGDLFTYDDNSSVNVTATNDILFRHFEGGKAEVKRGKDWTVKDAFDGGRDGSVKGRKRGKGGRGGKGGKGGKGDLMRKERDFLEELLVSKEVDSFLRHDNVLAVRKSIKTPPDEAEVLVCVEKALRAFRFLNVFLLIFV